MKLHRKHKLGPATDRHHELHERLSKLMEHADEDGLFENPDHDREAHELMREMVKEAAKREGAPAEFKDAAEL